MKDWRDLVSGLVSAWLPMLVLVGLFGLGLGWGVSLATASPCAAVQAVGSPQGLNAVAAAFFLAYAVYALAEAVWAPLMFRLGLPKEVLFYLTFLTGALLSWLSGLNLFPGFPEDVGKALTAAAVGAGPSVLHDLLERFGAENPWAH